MLNRHTWGLTAALGCGLALALPFRGAAQGSGSRTVAEPVDPRPGLLLTATTRGVQAREAWLYLDVLDAAAGTVTGRPDEKTAAITYRLLPYVSLRRFGAHGALPTEFRKDDRLRIRLFTLAPRAGARPVTYAAEIADEITDGIEKGLSYRVASLDPMTYTFQVEKLTGETPAGSPIQLEYGRGTFLVLREDPVYVFKPAPGLRFWMNTARRAMAEFPIAREVLDERSRERYLAQEKVRTTSRALVRGAPFLVGPGGGGRALTAAPDFTAILSRLAAGQAVEVLDAVGGAVLGRGTVASQAGAVVNLAAPAPGQNRPGRLVWLRPVREKVSYQRDVRPILDAGCLSCHREGNAQSGYSISTVERMHAG
ncbi:MAG: hypothetical protein FJX77_10435, partial [Armatimonadetes bacterium]|nr:hypothetical protein [Armatimonadota bacterium]